jgi:hypothetical protein
LLVGAHVLAGLAELGQGLGDSRGVAMLKAATDSSRRAVHASGLRAGRVAGGMGGGDWASARAGQTAAAARESIIASVRNDITMPHKPAAQGMDA